jgi:hypothetical protein
MGYKERWGNHIFDWRWACLVAIVLAIAIFLVVGIPELLGTA